MKTKDPRSSDSIERAIECLKHARRLLRKGGAKRAARRVAGALKSADGARRHALNMTSRTQTIVTGDALLVPQPPREPFPRGYVEAMRTAGAS